MAKKSSAGEVATPDGEKDWRAESDLRTLIEAEKIRNEPDRLKAAMKMHSVMKKAVDAVKA